MFTGIRIDPSKLITLFVLTILITVIGVSAARAQGTGGTTTRVTGAANVQGGAESKVVSPAKPYTLGLTGIPTVGGRLTAFDSKDCDKDKQDDKDCCDKNDDDCKHHKKHSPDK